jgi:hypothetical protein
MTALLKPQFFQYINLIQWRKDFKDDVAKEEKQYGIKPLVMFFHCKTKTVMISEPNEFRERLVPSLKAQKVNHRCRFFSVWRSASGQAYRVVHHQFSTQAADAEWDESEAALIMGVGFTTKALDGDFVYNELYPISNDSLLVALETAAKTTCASCGACGCLDKCDSCAATFCSPNHRALHLKPCGGSN